MSVTGESTHTLVYSERKVAMHFGRILNYARIHLLFDHT